MKWEKGRKRQREEGGRKEGETNGQREEGGIREGREGRTKSGGRKRERERERERERVYDSFTRPKDAVGASNKELQDLLFSTSRAVIKESFIIWTGRNHVVNT